MGLPEFGEVSSERDLAWLKVEAKIPDGLDVTICGESTLGESNSLPFNTMALLEGGVRFPLDPLLTECLVRWKVLTTQPSINVFRIVMGVVALNKLLNINLGYYEIMHCYQVVMKKNTGRLYLTPRKGIKHMVTDLPDSSAVRTNSFVLVKGDLFQPEDPSAAQIPLQLGSAVKNVNKGFDSLTDDQTAALVQVWSFENRTAPELLNYKPRYRHTRSHLRVSVDSKGSSSSSPIKSTPKVEVVEVSDSSDDEITTSDQELFNSFPSFSNPSLTDISTEDMVRGRKPIPSLEDVADKPTSLPKPTAAKSTETAAAKGTVAITAATVSAVGSKRKEPEPPMEKQAGKQAKASSSQVPKPSTAIISAPTAGGSTPTDITWAPSFKLSDGKAVTNADSVNDVKVATALASAYLLPKDMAKVEKMGMYSTRESMHKCIALVTL